MEISLHLGAHKTASTYIQSRLLHSHGNLRREGIDYVPLSILRADLTPHLWRTVRPGLGGLLHPRAFSDALDRLIDRAEARGTRRLLLSEENFLGNCSEIVIDGAFYPRVWGAMERLADEFGEAPVRIFLAVRGYADFFASAYGQVIRNVRYVGFDTRLKARLLAMRRGWVDVVSDIRAAFPDARIRLWRYEDMAMIEPFLFREILGAAAARRLCAFDERPLQGLSAAAFAEIGALRPASVTPAVVTRISQRLPKGRSLPAFDPWTRAERAELDARYSNELALIREAFPDMPLRVPEPA